MTDSSPKDLSASVRARVLNLSRSTGRDFQVLALRYGVERFLSRLENSSHGNEFILKGAMLYTVWGIDTQRTTMDLDLLGLGSPDPENLVRVFSAVCASDPEPDGLRFDTESITATPIREDATYDGVRLKIRVYLGEMLIRLQVDVGFGDAVVPPPERRTFPPLLAGRGPEILAYTPETVIAEKFEVMVQLGIANSRMKDYFDIWMISHVFTLDLALLAKAIRGTFERRNTPVPTKLPTALSDEFLADDAKRRQWAGFARRQMKGEATLELSTVVVRIREFLSPALQPFSMGNEPAASWDPIAGWQPTRP